MSVSLGAPGQHKQASRKGKKAWRKNIDITPVQEGLEDVREEIIQGGLLSEKPAEELFTLDTTGSTAIQKAYNKVHKPLKADEIIAQRSAVPAVDSRKRSSSKVTDGIIEPSGKKRRGGGVSHKELERLKQIAYGGDSVHKDVVKTDNTPAYDPWAVEPPKQDPRFSFLEPPKPVRAPKTLNEAPISLAADGKKIPAVKRPEGEMSYNPTFEDWSEALENAGQKEVEAELKRLQAEAAEQDLRERAAASAAQQGAEIDEGDDDESAWEGFESEAENEPLSARQRRPERKTQSQKNKAKRRKEGERQAKWEEKMQKKAAQAEQIKALAEAIEAKEKARAEASANGEDADESGEGDDTVLRRKNIRNAPFPEKQLELVLPDELSESLRLLKPEGNLVKDRFRNMIVRGKLESRRPITQPKKAKRTYTEKWTYKDFKI
ncbi:P60-like protein [Xylona heveae TC161]|uniref:Ribosome biogenesis protein NOP53 n=1 Tax=Xylona heveae (strain CBS 132557 / TC161) TaxID=1328760 RepID=A0A165HB14_XYLHT|nr:P60-like protein [Xylona heveae TC161]KZF23238.1 P60-like protein [Xylona heveae TC161]